MSGKKGNDEGKALQVYVSLIAQHQWALRGYILSMMPGSPDVDDVLQETNIVLWEKRSRFKEGSNFLAWATTIAKFQVMRQRDIAKRTQTVAFSDEFLQELEGQLAPIESKTPILKALDHCMGKLDDKQRQLLMVRYTPGKSIKSYADEVDTTPEVLRVTLHRVRQALKRCIDKSSGGETA